MPRGRFGGQVKAPLLGATGPDWDERLNSSGPNGPQHVSAFGRARTTTMRR